VNEISDGVPDFGIILGEFKKKKEIPCCLRSESLPFLTPFYRSFFDKVDRFDILRFAVLENIEVINGQIVDKSFATEDSYGDFDIDDDGLFLDLLRKKDKAHENNGRKKQYLFHSLSPSIL
jgi:hypothetical protein